MIKFGTGNYSYEDAEKTYELSSGGMKLCDLPVKVFQGFDLHHINELLKRYDPADMGTCSIQNKVREFRETVLLCKACHAEITHDVKAMADFMNDLFNAGVVDEQGNIIH